MAATTPAEVDQRFGECINHGDLEGVVELYEPTATLLSPDAGALVGHDALRPYFAAFLAMKPSIEMGQCTVIHFGGDLAAVHHDWRVELDGPEGTKLALSGKATEIVRRQPDGSWRFILDDPNMRG